MVASGLLTAIFILNILSLTTAVAQAQVPTVKDGMRLFENRDRVYVEAFVRYYDDRRVKENVSVGGSLFSASLNKSALKSRSEGDLRSAGFKVVNTYNQSEAGNTLVVRVSADYSHIYTDPYDPRSGIFGWNVQVRIMVPISTNYKSALATIVRYQWMGMERDASSMRAEAYRSVRNNLNGFIRDWRKYR